MSLAPQELENSASKFAAEAIKLDSQGARGMAIANYQRAIESLHKLIQLYPDNKLNRVYQERMAAYQNRIKALQMSNVEVEPVVDAKATPEEQKQSLSRSEFDSLLMK
ncbi:MAG: AAA family ATPase, partial [Thaumarchaeota archaeon]